jgi:hypothetical protein
MYSQVIDNFWNKPTYKKPYYYIHNVNSVKDISFENRATVPTNPYGGLGNFVLPTSNEFLALHNLSDIKENTSVTISETSDFSETGDYIVTYTDVNNNSKTLVFKASKISGSLESGTDVPIVEQYNGEEINTPQVDAKGKAIIIGKGNKESIKIGNIDASLREKSAEIRYGNRSEVRVEIRYGTDDSVFELTDVYIDYIKAPQHIRLTQKQLDTTEDTSQLLEFPDYVCQEIINELVHLVMENIGDQRLQTHPVVS